MFYLPSSSSCSVFNKANLQRTMNTNNSDNLILIFNWDCQQHGTINNICNETVRNYSASIAIVDETNTQVETVFGFC